MKFIFIISLILSSCIQKEYKVGGQSLSQNDVNQLIEVKKVYYENYKVHYRSLFKPFTFIEVLKNKNMPLTQSEIQNELKRIEVNSKDKKKLGLIKTIFKDEDTYLRLFIAPNAAKIKLQETTYPKDDSYHSNFYIHAKRIYDNCLIKLESCKKEIAPYSALIKYNIKNNAFINIAEGELKYKNKMDPIFKTDTLLKLNEGDVYPQFFTTPRHHRFYLFVKRKGHELTLNTVSILRGSYPKWLDAEISKVKLSY